jgi:hypothetical protein
MRYKIGDIYYIHVPTVQAAAAIKPKYHQNRGAVQQRIWLKPKLKHHQKLTNTSEIDNIQVNIIPA